MGASPVSKRAWALSTESFDNLLALLDSDRERAGERYESIRRVLVKFYICHGVVAPEEQADKTINRVVRKIDEGETIRCLERYFIGVARLVLLENAKEKARERKAFDLFAYQGDPPAEADDANRRLECLESCLDRLSSVDRDLIVGYYREEKSAMIDQRKRLAADLRMPLNALRIRAHRIRLKLRKCVSECVGRDKNSLDKS